LPEVKLTLDLAFGLRVFGDEMTHSETSQGSLKLGQGVGVAGFARLVTEEAQAVGIEVVGQSVDLKNPSDVLEVGEGGFGFDKACSDDAAGGVVNGEGEDLEAAAGPPLMGRAVMLEEVSVSFALPSSSRFWSACEWFPEEVRHVFEDVVSNVGNRAREGEAALDFISDKAVVGFFVDLENLFDEGSDFGWPWHLMISAGDFERTRFAICQPGGSQVVELAAADIEAGCGVLPCQGTAVEEREGVVDDLGRETVEKLFLFIRGLQGRLA
jgi:hypothetical protein